MSTSLDQPGASASCRISQSRRNGSVVAMTLSTLFASIPDRAATFQGPARRAPLVHRASRGSSPTSWNARRAWRAGGTLIEARP
jgi:hypothetical protein